MGTPKPLQWGLLFLIGLIATAGHWCIVRAYDHAEASLLAPLAYTEIVMATFAAGGSSATSPMAGPSSAWPS